MTWLLDVNVLIALLDPRHVAHDTAHDWFAAHGSRSWATCPITQNGFVRIVSSPKYGDRPVSPAQAVMALEDLANQPGHQFWPDALSLLDSPVIDSGALRTSAQITDTYLLALAVSHGARLATFDRRLVVDAVLGGKAALAVIEAAA